MAANEAEVDAPLPDEEVARLTDALVGRVGARVRALRRMLGLTYNDLARDHGIDRSQLSRIENGRQNLTARTAVRIAAALGVQPWELYITRDRGVFRPKPGPRPTPAEVERESRAFRAQIGARIRSLRQLQGMSVMSLALFAGVGEWTVCHLEAGKGNMRASTAVRLADAIGVHPHELYLPTEQSDIRPATGGGERDDG